MNICTIFRICSLEREPAKRQKIRHPLRHSYGYAIILCQISGKVRIALPFRFMFSSYSLGWFFSFDCLSVWKRKIYIKTRNVRRPAIPRHSAAYIYKKGKTYTVCLREYVRREIICQASFQGNSRDRDFINLILFLIFDKRRKSRDF